MADRPHKGFLLGALIGSTLGGLTAFFLNTPRGKKVQKDALCKYKEINKKIQKTKNKIKKKIK